MGNTKQRLNADGRLRESFSRGVAMVVLSIAAAIAWGNAAQAIVNKELIEPILTLPPNGTRVSVVADKITYDPRSKVSVATGMVKMVYGPFTLVATRVEYNSKTGKFKANGSVQVREPNGNVLLASNIELTNKFKLGFADHVKALLTNNATITAEHAQRYDGEITVYEKATYSACPDCKTANGNPVWQIVADKATHDNVTHDIYYDHPKFQIDGTTIAGLPYMAYPDPSVKRRSGWLAPDIKVGSVFGVGVAPTYFWALAPDYDLTFRPLFTTRQGPVADMEWRQALATGSYNIRARGVYQLTDLPAPDNQDFRGAITTEGKFALNQDWNWGWHGTFASDQTFLNHYGYDDREIAQNDVYATGLWDQNYVSAQLLNFDSLDTNVDQNKLPTALPYVTGEHIFRDMPLGGEVKVNWSAYSLHRNMADVPFSTVNHGTDQTRSIVEVAWDKQYTTDSGVLISPFAKLRSDLYITQNVPDGMGGNLPSETTGRVLPTAGVDMRYPFISSADYGQSIFTPVMQLISAADETNTADIGNENAITLNYDHTSLFLTDRFTGNDRFEGGTRANVGITYAYYDAGGGFLKANLGESYHIAGQNSYVAGSGLSGNQSDIVGNVIFQPWDSLLLSYEARMRNDFSGLDRQEASASLTFDRISANLAYLNIAAEKDYGRKVDETWVEGDGKVQLDNGWSVFGGLAYDFNYGVLTKKSLGLEFDCQCMNFRLAYTGTNDPYLGTSEDKVMMSIELATIGKAGFGASF